MKILTDLFEDCLEAVGVPRTLAIIVPSDRPDLADFQCNAALAASKALGKPPRQIAQEVVDNFSDPRFSLSIAGPGFINIRVNDQLLEQSVGLTQPLPRRGDLKFIDYGGPNVAKAMHVGHLRSLVIGNSLGKILDYQGYDVITDIHWGDWGYQMGLVLCALMSDGFQDWGGKSYSIEHLQKIYPLAAQYAKENEQFRSDAVDLTRRLQLFEDHLIGMWQKIFDATSTSVMADLKILNVEFDLYNGESTVGAMLPDMWEDLVRRELIAISDGADVIYCLDEKLPPLIFRNSEGGFLYAATDLATIQERAASNPSEIIYVVDQRQELHFRQVFDVAGQLGYDVKLTHVGFGTIQGFDGKPFRTRAGGVPKLRDLLDEAVSKALIKNSDPETARKVAMAAIKFNDLQNKRSTNYAYDIDRALAHEGKTGPYLLYQLVRMNSIMEKREVEPGVVKITNDDERQIVLDLLKFNSVLDKTVEQMSPHLLAEYLYGLAQKFSAYYAKHTISNDPSRLALVLAIQDHLRTGLGLLGIETVESM